MKRRVFSLLSSVCLFAVLASFTPGAMAQINYGNLDLYGTYAMQFTGTVNLPVPFNAYNGPFSRNGKVVFDGQATLLLP